MQAPAYTVPLKDLESGDKQRSWPLPPEWLAWALAKTEAAPRGLPGQLDLYLKKNGREVLVKGRARAPVQMPCARTLEPVDLELDAEIVLMLRPNPGQAAASSAGRKRKRRAQENADEQLTPELAAEDTFDGETIVLDGFVREHLLLELPLFPVRSDLPFQSDAATDTRPVEPQGQTPSIDPRLAPLAALASQLKTAKE